MLDLAQQPNCFCCLAPLKEQCGYCRDYLDRLYELLQRLQSPGSGIFTFAFALDMSTTDTWLAGTGVVSPMMILFAITVEGGPRK